MGGGRKEGQNEVPKGKKERMKVKAGRKDGWKDGSKGRTERRKE